MTSTRLARRLMGVVLAMALAGCEDPAGPDPVDSIALTAPTASVIVGQTLQITAAAKDEDGNVLADRTITWTSASDAIATVNAGGLVTGVTPGSVVITAKADRAASQFTLTVVPVPVATVAVNPDTATVPVGTTRQLTATAHDAGGNPLTGRAVEWSSSDTTVAKVSASGVVTSVKTGSATITATVEGKTGTSRVTSVPGPVATVAVTPQAPSVRVGFTIALAAETRDASGVVVTGRAVTWSTSDAGKATVSATGVVTGVAEGTVTITATSEGKSATTTVTVLRTPVFGVRWVPFFRGPFILGDTIRLQATAIDSTGHDLPDRPVTYSSSNAAVATVTPSGLLNLVAAGSFDLTATSEGKSITQSTVSSDVRISWGPNFCPTMKVGTTCGTSVTLRYAGGSSSSPVDGHAPTSITTGDPGIATVSAPTRNNSTISVTITAVAPGTTTVTAAYVAPNGITRTEQLTLTVAP